MAPNRARFAVVLAGLTLLALWATSQADTVSDVALDSPPKSNWWDNVRVTIMSSSSGRIDSGRNENTEGNKADASDKAETGADWRQEKPQTDNLPPSLSDSLSDQTSDEPLGRDGRPLTPEQVALGEKIRKTLALYESKHLNARDHSCWEVMHSLIAFGPRTQIYRDGPGGPTVNAIGWLCWGGRCQGQPLILVSNDRPYPLRGVGLQGHEGQYLAMLAQWRVRPESPMQLGGKDFTIADLIEEEKVTCQSGTELTFKLIALAHYLPSDAKWTSRNGEQWTIPKLLKAEIEAPIRGAACGGTHRLFGIANAVKIRKQRGEPIDGQWARAEKYIVDYERYTVHNLQNKDGSYSTEWFNRPADRIGDLDRKLQTTGHILEWLTWALPEDDLRDPRVIKSADFLASILLNNPERSWSIGPLGHGLHALMIYHQRMFTEPPLPETTLAGEPMKVRTAARPVASSQNPPEPECDNCPDAMSPERLRQLAEQSDNCVEGDQLNDAVREILLNGSTLNPLSDPIRRPVN